VQKQKKRTAAEATARRSNREDVARSPRRAREVKLLISNDKEALRNALFPNETFISAKACACVKRARAIILKAPGSF